MGKKIKEMERQDKELEKLPEPHQEQKKLKKIGNKLKKLMPKILRGKKNRK